MSLASLVSWVPNVLILILISYMVFVDLRYTLRRRRSRNWPTTAAKIEGAVLGRGVFRQVHFTYSYCVNGLQHTGRFYLLVTSRKTGEELRQSLVGRSVPVKYDERKPKVALLMDEALGGKRVMQGPSWTYR